MTNPSTQGGVPNGVTFDASGNIFASSQLGGPTNNGVAFELVHGLNWLDSNCPPHFYRRHRRLRPGWQSQIR